MNRCATLLFLVLANAVNPAAAATLPPMPLRLPAQAPASVREVQNRIYRAAERQAHYLLGTVAVTQHARCDYTPFDRR